MTKHTFPAYAFCKQKRYLLRHLIKPRSITLVLSKPQELNTHLEDFPPYTEGQDISPPPTDEIMDIIYHSMPTTWKYKMIE